MYRLHIDDRNYESFSIYDSTNMDKVELPPDFNPLTHHLFSNDLFSLSSTNEVKLLHSNVRNYEYISGVLILENDKTYGSVVPISTVLPSKSTYVSLSKKHYYKCIPDDIHLPTFLIPYEHKHIGFSKIYKNHYITFKFMQWTKNGSNTSSKPIGQIVQNIGPVDILDNFYEYQLYCKSLNASIQKLTKDTLASIKTNTSNIDKIKELYQLEERTDVEIFSIDPQGSVDFDDAFSIKEVADNTGEYILSIYISNVTIWLDYLNLWPSMSNRISTIYLPDRKRPMLPTVLSDCLCSLQEGEKRFALTMDLHIYFDFASSSLCIREIKYSNTIIQVKKNYIYDEPDLLTNIHYKQLKEVVASLNKNPASKYTGYIKDSHDVVEYLMVLMNHKCAQKLLDKGEGIFRCISSTATTNSTTNATTTTTTELTKDTNILPAEIANFAHIWSSNSSGKYINVKNKLETESLCHQFLNLESYVHITSPIRRLVDLLNIIQFQLNFDFVLSEKAQEFYQYWTSIEKVSYINTTTKSIKKVQNECNLLHLCSSDPSILEKVWNGYVFDIVEHNNGLFQYIIYIHELKIFGKIVLRDKLDLYCKKQFKLFIFNNEAKMKKKIRLQFIF
jgi:ribonuclease R